MGHSPGSGIVTHVTCAIAVLSLLTGSIGCLELPTDAPIRHDFIKLNLMDITSRVVNGSCRWDAKINVTQVRYVHDPIGWSDLLVHLTSHGGAEREEPAFLPYDGSPPAGLDLDLRFQDTVGRGDVPDVGDVIRLTGLSRAHQGGELSMQARNASLHFDDLYLPLCWNGTFTVGLGTPYVALVSQSEVSWNVTVEVLNITPAWEHVGWKEVQVGFHPYDLDGPQRDFLVNWPSMRGAGARMMDHQSMIVMSVDDYVTAGDFVLVRYLGEYYMDPDTFEGNELILFTGDVVIGYVKLPADFPETMT